ncbi:AbiH family protein [Psychrobacter phenylpyruvicus]|uniref:Bacteriophage abortive infection AbiH n=1 Tax=Psychrobacter phenylpyruvicus TaxID=29432 RepID=A0A379LIX1_9GAMM|nr:AbiH family protein [Psychrobacter phenylpyruvicus]SUD89857.1 Uncharacterised protein [Psychrobacter phenylpyruvicus]
MSTRKILILGNGFDLAHFLPTKYEHFIHAMRVIEDSEENIELSFNQLFESLIEEEKQLLEQRTKEIEDSDIEKGLKKKEIDQLIENYFLHCTEKLYKTNEFVLDVNEVNYLKNKLSSNGWFQYFKYYSNSGIETWIDFENEMATVLKSLCFLIDELEVNPKLFFTSSNRTDLSHSYISDELFQDNHFRTYPLLQSILNNFSIVEHYKSSGVNALIVKPEFIKSHYQHPISVSPSKILKYLEKQLKDFIEIFSTYIEFIERFKPKKTFEAPKILQTDLEAIYSFNYSNTVGRLYNQKNIHYLHGKAGEKEQNKIVLGISDLQHSLLEDEKAYGFVKYYQKLVNNTDYLFLKPKSIITEIESRKVNGTKDRSFWHPIEIYIWGHSLDSSDRDYIEEIFSFNQGKDTSIRVVIYFYNSPHQQLANLIYILGREIVETWMKNDWLEFIKMPNIYKLNFEEGYSDKVSKFSETIDEPIKKAKPLPVYFG